MIIQMPFRMIKKNTRDKNIFKDFDNYTIIKREMIIKHFLALLLSILASGCDDKGNRVNIIGLPDKNKVKSVYLYNVGKQDKYWGKLKLKTEKNTGKLIINEESKASDIIGFIRTHIDKWEKVSDKDIQKPKNMFVFLNNIENDPEIILWLENSQLTILTRPIDPRHVHWTFLLDANSLAYLNNKLSSNP